MTMVQNISAIGIVEDWNMALVYWSYQMERDMMERFKMDYAPAWELLYFPTERSKLSHKFTSKLRVSLRNIVLYIYLYKITYILFFLGTRENLCKDGFTAMVFSGEPTEWNLKGNFAEVVSGA